MSPSKMPMHPTWTDPGLIAKPEWIPTTKTCTKCERTAWRKVAAEQDNVHLLACNNCGHTTTTTIKPPKAAREGRPVYPKAPKPRKPAA